MKAVTFLFCFFVLGSIVSLLKPFNPPAADGDDDTSFQQHVELGSVRWHRDFKQGEKIASSTGKPMFLLFQEIPGCQTCQNYGNRPLSHPLLVEAIEDLFVPVAIFNNRQGLDAETLKKFGEPAWNNPVVRYVDGAGTDLIERKDGIWSTGETASRMVEALEAAGKTVPTYLKLVQSPPESETETAEFAMHCYWAGEAKFGSLDGVVATRAGWRDGLEVVELRYLPKTISYTVLVQTAKSFQCASRVFTHTDQQQQIARKLVGADAVRANGKMRDASPSDQKYHLANSIYRHLPLTQLQATRINGFVSQPEKVAGMLSPRQSELLKRIRAVETSHPDALATLVRPTDDGKLAAYRDRLERTLAENTDSR